MNQDPIYPIAPSPISTQDANDSSGSRLPRSSKWKDVFVTLGIFMGAFAVAFIMITFVFQSYVVDGPSMQSTLHDQDRLIVWKVPRTWAKITGHYYIPNRGDIIIFNQKGLSEFGQENEKQLIKRVIGLPGDRVVVQRGEVTIYNQQHPSGFQPDKTLSYGKDIPTTSGNIDITLKKGQLFVCGDNRPDSLDSRSFGPISANSIVGKLALRIFPVGGAKAF